MKGNVFQVWSLWITIVARQISINFLVFIGIKHLNQVADVPLSSAGAMMGAQLFVCAVWSLLTAWIADYLRRNSILTTTQVCINAEAVCSFAFG